MSFHDLLAELLGVTIPGECRKWAVKAADASRVSPRDLAGLEQMVRDANYLTRVIEKEADEQMATGGSGERKGGGHMSASEVLDRITMGLEAGRDAPELLSRWLTSTREAIEAVQRLRSSLAVAEGSYLSGLLRDAGVSLGELEDRLAYASQRLIAGR